MSGESLFVLVTDLDALVGNGDHRSDGLLFVLRLSNENDRIANGLFIEEKGRGRTATVLNVEHFRFR